VIGRRDPGRAARKAAGACFLIAAGWLAFALWAWRRRHELLGLPGPWPPG
jgi:hypothetical protein